MQVAHHAAWTTIAPRVRVAAVLLAAWAGACALAPDEGGGDDGVQLTAAAPATGDAAGVLDRASDAGGALPPPEALARLGVVVALSPDELRGVLGHSPLPPPPADPTNAVHGDERAAALGQFLFFDPSLSANGEVSCASCHQPDRSWTDGLPRGVGLAEVARNTPSLWNAAYNRWSFWDGRADSLWAQALAPLEDEKEHGLSRLAVVRRLAQEPELRAAYEALFGALPDVSDTARFGAAARPVPEDPSHPHALAWERMAPADRDAVDRAFANAGKCIAAFVARIVSDRAPFDVFVEGLRSGDAAGVAALSPSAQRGMKLFMGAANCHVCHAGPEFSDLEFHDIRVPPAPGMPVDLGRFDGVRHVLADPFNGVGPHSDDRARGELRVGFLDAEHPVRGEFKTPTLRNVALSAPYMHQGQFADLDAVLDYYSTLDGAIESAHPEKILVPLGLTAAQKADLVAFLESLTDAALDPALTSPPPSPLPR